MATRRLACQITRDRFVIRSVQESARNNSFSVIVSRNLFACVIAAVAIWPRDIFEVPRPPLIETLVMKMDPIIRCRRSTPARKLYSLRGRDFMSRRKWRAAGDPAG